MDLIVSSDANLITSLEDVKQEIQDLKAIFECPVNEIKGSIEGKFTEINGQLKDNKGNFTKSEGAGLKLGALQSQSAI